MAAISWAGARFFISSVMLAVESLRSQLIVDVLSRRSVSYPYRVFG